MNGTRPIRLDWKDDVAYVYFDDPEASVNKLTRTATEAFSDVLEELEEHPAAAGAVLLSEKPDSFIVGADVQMLRKLMDTAEATALSATAHALLERLRTLSIPTVAAIHGPAMGGGLELALACTYRVVTDDPATRLALPEVKLGLCPGAGGTQYLPRLIGLERALPLMLTGSNVYSRRARRLGLADAVCSSPLLERTAISLLRRHVSDDSATRRGQSLRRQIIDRTHPGRAVVFRMARRKVQAETKGHYPAPERIIDCVRTGFEEGLDRGLEMEAQTFGALLMTPQARALVSLFFAKQHGDHHPNPHDARDVQRIGVLGAGLMGSGIAVVSAEKGMDVVVKDRTLEIASAASRSARRSAGRLLAKGALSPFEMDAWVSRVLPTDEYAPLHAADLVIEAVPEDLDLKRSVLKELERVVRADCVIATNTSAIPLALLHPALDHPERLVGMHYFSPVERMPLLEIVRSDRSSDSAIATARAVGLRQGKTIIVVGDGPGFYTTRILALYMNEALLLLEEGLEIGVIDGVARKVGFPMGPFELFDLVGIDTAAKITGVLEKEFRERDIRISNVSSVLSDAGVTGQRAGQGFYTYRPRGAAPPERLGPRDRAVRDMAALPPRVNSSGGSRESIEERLVLTMVNEAVRCLGEGLLSSPVDGNLGAVFGLGFPPYMGGPFLYVDQATPQAVVLRLQRLCIRHGDRFEPAPLMKRHSEAGTSFHTSNGSA